MPEIHEERDGDVALVSTNRAEVHYALNAVTLLRLAEEMTPAITTGAVRAAPPSAGAQA